MTCPYCNGAMESGYLQGGHGVILFTQEPGSFLRTGRDFRVSSLNPLKKPPKAWYCSACRKIIADVEAERPL